MRAKVYKHSPIKVRGLEFQEKCTAIGVSQSVPVKCGDRMNRFVSMGLSSIQADSYFVSLAGETDVIQTS